MAAALLTFSDPLSAKDCKDRFLDEAQRTINRVIESRLASLPQAQITREGKPGGTAGFVLPALLDAYEATRRSEHLSAFVALADRVLASRDDRAGFRDYRGRSAAQWSTNAYNSGGRYISFLIDDGGLAGPLARFASIARRDECAGQLVIAGRKATEIAAEYAAAAAETMAFHEGNWSEEAVDGQTVGFFHTARDADFILPEVPGRAVPLNYQTMMGVAYVYLFSATGDQRFSDRAVKIANFLRVEIKRHGDGSATWPYWPWMTYRPDLGWAKADTSTYSYLSPDDLSHGSVTVMFLAALREAGLAAFSEGEMAQFAKAFEIRVHSKPSPPLYIDGSGPPAGRYAFLHGRVSALTVESPKIWHEVCEVVWRGLDMRNVQAPYNDAQKALALASLGKLLLYAPLRDRSVPDAGCLGG